MMRAFRLETFAPAAEAARIQKDLERALRDAAREEGYEAGYVAGQAAATQAHLEEQARLASELVEAISDGQVTNEAARAAVLAGIVPIVAKLFETIAPSLAELGLPDEIARRVDAALRAVPSSSPRIRCAPEVAGAVRAALAGRQLAAAVEPAPELLPCEAEVAWAHGYDRVDLDGCIADIRTVIETHLNPQEAEDGERLYG